MTDNLAEAALISVLINDNSKIQDVDISDSYFSSKVYSQIFNTIKTMIGDRQVVDVISLAESMLTNTGRDWLDTITGLATETPAASENTKAYVEIIKKQHRSRVTKKIAETLLEAPTEENIADTIKKLMELGKQNANYEYTFHEGLKLALQDVDNNFKNKGCVVGLPSGLNSLDECLGGFHEGDLVILPARPAMGKTSVMLNFMLGAKAKVGCISGEQGISQICQRLMSMQGRVSLAKLRNGLFDQAEFSALSAGVSTLHKHPGIMFYDRSGPTMDEIESVARKWKFDHDIKGLYVDYVQKIKFDKSKNKAEAIGDNASRLKDLARELNIPVIALAQVSRAVESRNDRRPRMGDISDSSEIEKEADQIIMLYRDEVYDPDTYEKGIMELIVEKNRHGPIGNVFARWDAKFLSIGNLSEPTI